MKTLKAIIILCSLLFCLCACKKENTTTPGFVVGKWNIVSVSQDGTNYAGKTDDYYEFTANGVINIKEGTALETVNYTMSADSTLTITFPNNTGALAEWGRVTTFTAHSLVIDGLYPVSPGGQITAGNSINLNR